MTFEIGLVFFIIISAVILFFTEKFTIDTVSIGVMVAFLLTGILEVDEGLSGFSNPATITVAAMFVVSAAIFNTGLLDSFTQKLSSQAGKGQTHLLFTLMISAGFLSAFISDTAVVALLMPAVIRLNKTDNIPPSKLLMPLSFGALMGGICTLLGTSTNILVSGIAEKSGLPSFGVFEMSLMGLVFFATGLIYMLTIGRWLTPSRKPKTEIGESIQLGNYLSELVIQKDFEQLNEPLFKQAIFEKLPIKALQIIRSDGRKVRVYPNTSIQEGDIIRINSDKENLEKIKTTKGIELKADLKWNVENITNDDERLYEAMVTPNSFLINKSIKDLNFKKLYNQVLVIGIRHRSDMLESLLARTALRAGDILLLRATDESIQSIESSDDLLLLSETKSKILNKKKSFLTLAVLALIIGLASFEVFPIVVTAVAGAITLIMLRSLSAEQAYKAIDWKVILMLAGVLSMGMALEKTGGSQLIGSSIVDGVGQYGPRAVMSALFALTFMLTNVMSNNATAALLAPIAISIAAALNVDSRPMLMAVTFAASLSFMTPMGYQTNTMIYTPGNYRFSDYIKIGTPLNLLLWIVATIGIPYFFPF
ncbi:di/tricarboxylate transporter [Algoriphagus ratkowskyi]|uniref:Di/tricarboxylate transporter n=1 Tax=Algoriphagus ratkowskyi TaxID=57028 RepID=A0A2W7RHK9_9BACT|nr:SLC13 family permease [Algoriphagus ratkowskyi]PZX53809.1 di/tricarboxylate transporter [Algoriphagus ratkowskyi]TXD76786.1 SLC13 family permease [Algoriphagus ratkowskyi]